MPSGGWQHPLHLTSTALVGLSPCRAGSLSSPSAPLRQHQPLQLLSTLGQGQPLVGGRAQPPKPLSPAEHHSIEILFPYNK